MTNWMTLRSQSIAHSWPEQIISLWIVATLLSVSKSWPVACLHHQDKTGKGFRGWQDTYDINLGAYSGMHTKAQQAKSLASLTVTGPDVKERADPPLADACCGAHTLLKCGRTQALVSLSSAEAELYAAIKACSETLGFLSLLKDYQIHANGKVMSDANAALGIMKRQGLGRTRHIHTSYLWIQQVNERGINFSKVPGSENCADLFTKPLTRESAEHLSELVGMEFPEGHDEIAFTMNFMGQYRRHISSSLQTSLQNLGVSGMYSIWTRMDLRSKCFWTSAKGGPSWKDVVVSKGDSGCFNWTRDRD